MKSTLNPSPKQLAERCIVQSVLPGIPCIKTTLQEDEQVGFATIDGNMVTYHAGSSAVSSGAGIFIGDYFVGLADNYESVSITPFIRY
ncbi:hypothetical protein C8N40_11299 [Pontibacter mucosus]|uniref:Uncharacterized protein n=1 Tax=Pontibacter mucosus TaxID=1649266 RepID=A0A2T5YCQ8_9BACT|nr:hypothetical protein [Pontibacter mucosus]PTX14252.1 hypothetical protein C8N40_11299 [Pontibacter mucosus]